MLQTESATAWTVEDEADWLRRLEREEVVKNMPIDTLRAHLAVQGWVPVEATRQALQRGCERVMIIEHQRGLSCGYYTHPHELPRVEVPWDSIPTPRLRMMAVKIAGVFS
jgi:hypothetical protein